MGCDKRSRRTTRWKIRFNPRTPGGVRRIVLATISFGFEVSIHAPRVGCDVAILYDHIHDGGVSIHAPRVGCDDSKRSAWVRFSVSIHAPRVGCDWMYLRSACERFVSIHAPRVGCDPSKSAENFSITCFNPRTPGGVRPFSTGPNAAITAGFNPRTPGGVRRPYSLVAVPLQRFNPRTPGGVRLAKRHSMHSLMRFNPRTPGGVRPLTHRPPCFQARFQSTHPGWGATACIYKS